ncbi:MAG TPA: C-terminal helicase domain-containing protein [Ilumatobacteraceae bacterium]|nr:C-terminal helicase domain-containing protein [Ilumatobacteraceae bacterium]
MDDEDVTDDDAADGELAAGSPATRYAALLSANPAGLRWVRPDLFDDALRADLDTDTSQLQSLLDWYGTWAPDRDSKLAALIELVAKTHPNEKVLVFTEYRDTATYVAAQLEAAGVDGVGLATGETENPTAVAHRFAPVSSALPGQDVEMPANELRVLVATDVLSEGQNLQDAHIVVNYDLPWAIIRLIQRAGRIDRIGQTSHEVRVYSFFHESVDDVIALRQRIADRLAANAEAFGSDERFFGTVGETQVIVDLYNGQLDDVDDGGEVDASSMAYQYWKNLEDNDPDLARRIAALPDLLDATRSRRASESEDGVACYVRTHSGVDGFGFAALDGTTRLLTGHEALRVFEAPPDEPGRPLRDDHDVLVRELVQGPLSAPTVLAGRLRGVRRAIWQRLGETLQAHDGDTSNALEALYQHPLTSEADRRLRRAIRNGISDDDLSARIAALHRDDALVVEVRTGADPVRIVSTMGVAQ